MSSRLVREIFQAFREGDIDRALSPYAADVVIRQAPGTPWAGTYVGRAGFDDFAAKLFAAIGGLDIVDTVFVGDGELVVVKETLRLKARDSSVAPLEIEAVEIFEVAGERVRRVDVWYRDPAAVSAWLDQG